MVDHKLKLLKLTDKDYPLSLSQIYDPPTLLYYLGNKNLLTKKLIAVVGSRKMTDYGKWAARELTTQLCQHAFVIVSGLARGIDTCAHQAALEAKGATIAILGSGFNHIYPPENNDLSQEIVAKGGLLVSEYPPEQGVLPLNFPRRNRIISGLSLGVLVIEASIKSGSLITARLAGEQGREVFALPGPIDSPESQGTAMLIQNGAKLVARVEDILEEISD